MFVPLPDFLDAAFKLAHVLSFGDFVADVKILLPGQGVVHYLENMSPDDRV